MHIHMVFSVGLPRSTGSNVFQRDGFNVTLNERAGKKLVENAKAVNATRLKLDQEMREHSDLLVGDYEDSYYNLTLKLFYTFQWAARFCRPYKPIFIFMDDDYGVNLLRLAQFLNSKKAQKGQNIAHGYVLSYNPVHRPQSHHPRWAFSKREIPWPRHPKEHLGIFSIFSYHHVHDMAIGMHFVKPMVIDDTWLAMVQLKLNIRFTVIPGMFINMLRRKNAKCNEIFFAPTAELRKRKCFSI